VSGPALHADPAPADAAWQAFAAELAEHLAQQWPAMPTRLGERYAAFVEHALSQGEQRGLKRFGAAARYANLCFVWGPSFQERAGFEWAANLLNNASAQDWATSHRLLQRSLRELERLPDRQISPELLEQADIRVVERFGGLGRRTELPTPLRAPPPLPAPRRACDLEAAELRVLSRAVEQRYMPVAAGGWSREPLPPTPPLRVTLTQPLPALVAALSVEAHEAGPTRLQARAAFHAHCDDRVHPALLFDGPHGRWQWFGHETRAVSWPLHTLAQPVQADGPGTAIAEETSPAMLRLALQTCGLRDEAEPLGPLETQVWVWPAAQWWMQWQRSAPVGVAEGSALAPPAAPMRAQVERDGQPQDASALRRGFERGSKAGLDDLADAAWARLLRAWCDGEGLVAAGEAPEPGAAAAPPNDPPRLGMARGEGLLAFLVGQAAATWGWQLGAAGMAERPFMRCVGALDLRAVLAQLSLEAELGVHGGSARIALAAAGESLLRQSFAADLVKAGQAPLAPRAAVAGCRSTLRLPWRATVVPLATPQGSLLQEAGACRGALVAEAGLRPRSRGGTGLEWFASLRCEVVSLPMCVVDPLLGRRDFVQPLLPALTLLDWCGP
jgi:hypothetical protein